MRQLIIVLLASLALGQQAFAANASFKCNAQSSKVEKLICSDKALAQKDVSAANLYKAAMKSLPKDQQQSLREEQRGWLEGRNACDKAADMRACIDEDYTQRIKELKDR